MRTFNEIQQALGLKRLLGGPLGTMYYIPYVPGREQVNVRSFDSELPPCYVNAYADLIGAAQRWIEQHPQLSRLVWIDQPCEIGRDFIARKHHRFFNNTTSAFADDEDPIEVPPELEQMRQAFRAVLGQPSTAQEQIIIRVLTQTLLEPAGKTYFDYETQRFVVAEPHLTPDDVVQWFELMK